MSIAASVLGDKEPIVFGECPADRFGECSVNVRRIGYYPSEIESSHPRSEDLFLGCQVFQLVDPRL